MSVHVVCAFVKMQDGLTTSAVILRRLADAAHRVEMVWRRVAEQLEGEAEG